MTDNAGVLPVTPMLRVLGWASVILFLATVGGAALAYIRDNRFSFFSTYLSDMGNTPVWPQAVFNAGMLIGIPARLLFLVLLVTLLTRAGAGRGLAIASLAAAAVLAVTSIGMYAVPFSVSRAIHLSSALVYFFGIVVVQILIAIQEWRCRMPPVLPFSCVLVLALSLVFATLLAAAGRMEGVTRETPVIWEWMLFFATVFWWTVHTIVLGRQRARQWQGSTPPSERT